MYVLISFDDYARKINTGMPVTVSKYEVVYSADFETIFAAYDNVNDIIAKDAYLICDPQINTDGLETYTIWPYVKDALTFLGYTPVCARVRRMNIGPNLDSKYTSRQIGEIFALTIEFINKTQTDFAQICTTTIMFKAEPFYDILPKIALSIINNINHITSRTAASAAIFRKFNSIMHIFRAEFRDNSLGVFSMRA
jgi:hypothetical protein